MTTQPEPRPTKVQEVLKLHDVPPAKWYHIAGRTLAGTLVFATGLFGGIFLDWNQWVVVGFCAVGAHMFSGQILTASIEAILGLVVKAVAVVAGVRKTKAGDE